MSVALYALMQWTAPHATFVWTATVSSAGAAILLLATYSQKHMLPTQEMLLSFSKLKLSISGFDANSKRLEECLTCIQRLD